MKTIQQIMEQGGSAVGAESRIEHETKHLSPEQKKQALYHHNIGTAASNMCDVARAKHHFAQYRKICGLQEALGGGSITNNTVKMDGEAADPKKARRMRTFTGKPGNTVVVREDKLIEKKDIKEIRRGRTATGQKANKVNLKPNQMNDVQRRLEIYRKLGQ